MPTGRITSGDNVYAANGVHTPNLGGQTVAGTSINDKRLGMEFNVGNVSRPLASIGEILAKTRRAVLDPDESYIESSSAGAWTPLRREGRLFYLDNWCNIPSQLANSPFVREVHQNEHRPPDQHHNM